MGKKAKSKYAKMSPKQKREATLPADVEARQYARRHGLRVFASGPNEWWLFNAKSGVQIGRWFAKHGTLTLFGAAVPKARTIQDVVRTICEMHPEQMMPHTLREMGVVGAGQAVTVDISRAAAV